MPRYPVQRAGLAARASGAARSVPRDYRAGPRLPAPANDARMGVVRLPPMEKKAQQLAARKVGLKIAGRVAARFIPVVGVALTLYDLYELYSWYSKPSPGLAPNTGWEWYCGNVGAKFHNTSNWNCGTSLCNLGGLTDVGGSWGTSRSAVTFFNYIDNSCSFGRARHNAVGQIRRTVGTAWPPLVDVPPVTRPMPVAVPAPVPLPVEWPISVPLHPPVPAPRPFPWSPRAPGQKAPKPNPGEEPSNNPDPWDDPEAWPRPRPSRRRWARPSRQNPQKPDYILPPLPGIPVVRPNVPPEVSVLPPSVTVGRPTRPGRPPRVRPGPKSNPTKPAKNPVRELPKQNIRTVGGAVVTLVNGATEAMDFVEAMHDAVEKGYRLSKKASRADKIEYMLTHLEPWFHLDAETAIENYINNQVSDAFSAIGSDSIKKVYRETGGITGLDRALREHSDRLFEAASLNGDQPDNWAPEVDINLETGEVTLTSPYFGGLYWDHWGGTAYLVRPDGSQVRR